MHAHVEFETNSKSNANGTNSFPETLENETTVSISAKDCCPLRLLCGTMDNTVFVRRHSIHQKAAFCFLTAMWCR